MDVLPTAGRTDFLPLLVLMRRGAALVKASTVAALATMMFLENPREFREIPILLLKFGNTSAFRYCTGNF